MSGEKSTVGKGESSPVISPRREAARRPSPRTFRRRPGPCLPIDPRAGERFLPLPGLPPSAKVIIINSSFFPGI